MQAERELQQEQGMDPEMPDMGNFDMPDMGGMNPGQMPSGGGMPNMPSPQMGGQGGHSDRVHPHLQRYNTVYHITGDDEDGDGD